MRGNKLFRCRNPRLAILPAISQRSNDILNDFDPDQDLDHVSLAIEPLAEALAEWRRARVRVSVG